MAAAAAGMQAAGGLLGFFGERSAGEDAQYAANLKASQDIENANAVTIKAADQERQLRIIGGQAVGNMRANYGASGVQSSEGSPLEMLQQSASNVERDALTARYAGEFQAANFRRSAAYQTWSGGQSLRAHQLAAYGSLLGAGGKIAGAYSGGGSGGGGGSSTTGDPNAIEDGDSE